MKSKNRVENGVMSTSMKQIDENGEIKLDALDP